MIGAGPTLAHPSRRDRAHRCALCNARSLRPVVSLATGTESPDVVICIHCDRVCHEKPCAACDAVAARTYPTLPGEGGRRAA